MVQLYIRLLIFINSFILIISTCPTFKCSHMYSVCLVNYVRKYAQNRVCADMSFKNASHSVLVFLLFSYGWISSFLVQFVLAVKLFLIN